MPVRLSEIVADGLLGIGTIVHALPSQCTAITPLSSCPAAQQSESETHVTFPRPFRSVGLGESTIVHDVPSQCSMSVFTALLLLGSSKPPAAQQFDSDANATPKRAAE